MVVRNGLTTSYVDMWGMILVYSKRGMGLKDKQGQGIHNRPNPCHRSLGSCIVDMDEIYIF